MEMNWLLGLVWVSLFESEEILLTNVVDWSFEEVQRHM